MIHIEEPDWGREKKGREEKGRKRNEEIETEVVGGKRGIGDQDITEVHTTGNNISHIYCFTKTCVVDKIFHHVCNNAIYNNL